MKKGREWRRTNLFVKIVEKNFFSLCGFENDKNAFCPFVWQGLSQRCTQGRRCLGVPFQFLTFSDLSLQFNYWPEMHTVRNRGFYELQRTNKQMLIKMPNKNGCTPLISFFYNFMDPKRIIFVKFFNTLPLVFKPVFIHVLSAQRARSFFPRP